jgi:hypothetical protein
MNYINFYATLTYRIPRNEPIESAKAHQAGEVSEESWSGYFLSFLKKENYTNYYSYLEGRAEARDRERLRI